MCAILMVFVNADRDKAKSPKTIVLDHAGSEHDRRVKTVNVERTSRIYTTARNLEDDLQGVPRSGKSTNRAIDPSWGAAPLHSMERNLREIFTLFGPLASQLLATGNFRPFLLSMCRYPVQKEVEMPQPKRCA